MELFWFIFLFVIFYFIYKKLSDTPHVIEVSDVVDFSLHIDLKAIDDIKCLIFSIKGKVNTPPNTPTIFVLLINDTTDGIIRPIYTPIKELSSDNGCFSFQTKPETFPNNNFIINDWVELCKIPIDLLIHPESGLRNITAQLNINSTSGRVYEKANCTFQYRSDVHGYKEIDEKVAKFEQIAIKAAWALCVVDGHFNKEEGNIITLWAKKRLDRFDENDLDSEKKRFNSYIKDGFDNMEINSKQINGLVNKLTNYADSSDKYEFLELCVNIIGADEHASSTELHALHEIKDILNIHDSHFRKLTSSIININFNETSHPGLLFGISNNMDKSEIKKIILNETKHWMPLQGSKDIDKRNKAKKMLSLLRKCKTFYNV